MQTRKVLGPYEVLDFVGSQCLPVVEFPYAEVRGGNLSVSIVENLTVDQNNGLALTSQATFEVEIVGVLGGQFDVLKRGWITGMTGQLKKAFEDWDAYDGIIVRCRNMVAGRPAGNWIAGDPADASSKSTQLGFYARMTVNIQPRWFPPALGGGKRHASY